MANAKQLREAMAEAMKFSFEREPLDADRRCVCFVSFLTGWLGDSEPGIAKELRRLNGLAATPATDGA